MANTQPMVIVSIMLVGLVPIAAETFVSFYHHSEHCDMDHGAVDNFTFAVEDPDGVTVRFEAGMDKCLMMKGMASSLYFVMSEQCEVTFNFAWADGFFVGNVTGPVTKCADGAGKYGTTHDLSLNLTAAQGRDVFAGKCTSMTDDPYYPNSTTAIIIRGNADTPKCTAETTAETPKSTDNVATASGALKQSVSLLGVFFALMLA